MSDYIITVNSTVDTTREWLAERGVPYIPLKYTIDGQTYSDMEGLSSKEFFDKLREGKMSTTSQINPDEAREALEPYLKEGKDILHLSFSSGLSGTCNSMKIAAEELQEEYPERKIIVIDTLCACLGEALLLYYVLKQKENGATIEEAAKWAEENKLHICHDVTVDDLNHLHRGGRVPLRYNNDKQKKPLFSRGLSVCRLLFNSFSKLKIDENYKEKRRLFY